MVDQKKKISAKDAVKIAKNYVQEMLAMYSASPSLEEIELTDDGKIWLVTVGIPKPYGLSPEKDYKIFEKIFHIKLNSYIVKRLNCYAA